MDLPGWEWVGKGVDSLENHMAQEEALGGCGHTPPVKPQRVRCKLEEAIEKPWTDILAHTLEVCKGIPSDERMPGYQGYSWLMGNQYDLYKV
jgi:hypothetical protein